MKKLILSLLLLSSVAAFAQTSEDTKIYESDALPIIKEECINPHMVDGVLMSCSKMPEYPGGFEALLQFLKDNLYFPPSAKEANIQGTVYVQFIVEIDGSLTHVEIKKGVDPDLDAEAVRVVKLMPKWIPGEQAGKKVRVKFTLPIKFRLQ